MHKENSKYRRSVKSNLLGNPAFTHHLIETYLPIPYPSIPYPSIHGDARLRRIGNIAPILLPLVFILLWGFRLAAQLYGSLDHR